MGKAAMLLVAAALMLLTGLYGQMARTGYETDENQANYEEKVLARETAQSAFNILVARTRADYENHRPDKRNVKYRDGKFSYRGVGPADGPVQLTAIGEVGDARHVITGTLVLQSESKFAALTYDGPVEEIDPRGMALVIDGTDTPRPGDEDLLTSPVNAYGVHSTLEDVDALAKSEFNPTLITGLVPPDGASTGPGSFTDGPTSINFVDVANKFAAHPDVRTMSGTVRWKGNERYGSRENPWILVIDGDLEVKGNVEFYGALVVRGSLQFVAGGTPRFEGLIISQSQGGWQTLHGNTKVYGAWVVQGLTVDGEPGGEPDAGLADRHFDVSVFDGGGAVVYQAHQYDDRFGTTNLDLLSAGCGVEGGLCWKDLVTDSGALAVNVALSNAGGNNVKITYGSTGVTLDAGNTSTIAPVPLASLNSFVINAVGGPCPFNDAEHTADIKTDNVLTMTVTDAAGGATLYEILVYHHVKEGQSCDGGRSAMLDVEPISFGIRGNPSIFYSSQALSWISAAADLPELAPTDAKPVLINVRDKTDSPSL